MQIREETHYDLNLLPRHLGGDFFVAAAGDDRLGSCCDARRPWKRYQAEASALLDRFTSDNPAAWGRSLPRNAGRQARGVFGEIPPPSWDGVIALRGIEIPGFDRDGTVPRGTPVDRCVTCHALIDWVGGRTRCSFR